MKVDLLPNYGLHKKWTQCWGDQTFGVVGHNELKCWQKGTGGEQNMLYGIATILFKVQAPFFKYKTKNAWLKEQERVKEVGKGGSKNPSPQRQQCEGYLKHLIETECCQ